MRIRDVKNSDSGSVMEKIRIRNKHPGSATLLTDLFGYKLYLGFVVLRIL